LPTANLKGVDVKTNELLVTPIADYVAKNTLGKNIAVLLKSVFSITLTTSQVSARLFLNTQRMLTTII